MIAPSHRSVDPSLAPSVTSRLRAAGFLPIKIVNDVERRSWYGHSSIVGRSGLLPRVFPPNVTDGRVCLVSRLRVNFLESGR
jgi:hypothetical protein